MALQQKNLLSPRAVGYTVGHRPENKVVTWTYVWGFYRWEEDLGEEIDGIYSSKRGEVGRDKQVSNEYTSMFW